jgi:hypothetical protein
VPARVLMDLLRQELACAADAGGADRPDPAGAGCDWSDESFRCTDEPKEMAREKRALRKGLDARRCRRCPPGSGSTPPRADPGL